eukprot:gnl/TRDRNA2_/TRDRNA2_136713_c0_seq1.p1 gnl/TRDRNA2_/TRDRNA2_136713_c0~~gnl/TRDRNA2_/TRDRNA2_136713_c0_seq1.p1  ORF type:complete len:345 (+),score=68.42 gnl/TRDRNA2_/TRDRNA2_136713_c0_seq1:49-1083(+)
MGLLHRVYLMKGPVLLLILGFCTSGVQSNGPLHPERLRLRSGASRSPLAPAAMLDVTDVADTENDAAAPAPAAAEAIPEVEHNKKAGKGYLKGSPLYEKAKQAKKLVNAGHSAPGDRVIPFTPFWARWTKSENDDESPYGITDPSFIRTPQDFWNWLRWEYMKQFDGKSVLWTILGYVIQLLFIVIIGFLYQMYKKRKLAIADFSSNEPNFHFGFFDCGCRQKMDRDDLEFLACSICCAEARFADSASSAKLGNGTGIMSFWPIYLTISLLVLLGELSFGITWLFVIALGIFFRQKIRMVYGLAPREIKNMACDLGAWCCCCCCAIFQEARQIEKVKPQPSAKA